MIPKIEHILYATDLSDNSAYVFRYASDFAKKYRADITILHVLEQLPTSGRALLSTYLNDKQQSEIIQANRDYAKDRIAKRLRLFCDRELKDDPECVEMVKSIEVSEGFPADEILSKADTFNCDVIVLGAHGKGIISHTFLGSTSEKVLRRSRKPVYIVPIPEGEIDVTFHDI
ncbi:MAG: universal stress protein [Deltaproteobacteria bacterium]|nr:universal stress protein [Deltaproteobacteria bacterium]